MYSIPGSDFGIAPVAITKFFVSNFTACPLSFLIFISISVEILEIEANPLITSMLFFFNKNWTPDDSFDASLDLFTIFSISKVISPLILKPKSLNLSKFF